MRTHRFIETNVLVRLVARDNDIQARLTDRMFQDLAAGDFQGVLSMTVFFEVSFVLEKTYGKTREQVADAILEIARAEGIRLIDGDIDVMIPLLELYVTYAQLSFADCYHAVLALTHCDGEIYTFDKEFRRVPGITRMEPGE